MERRRHPGRRRQQQGRLSADPQADHQDESTPTDPEHPPHGADAASFPLSPELSAARSAFERGDFQEARRIAGRLLARADAAEPGRAEAERLMDRLRVDPLAVGLGIACLILFVIVVYL